MTMVTVSDLVIADEPGFACSKTKLVESGLPHLRPFNIGENSRLNLSQVFQIPLSEAPKEKVELLPGDILFNNTNSAELVGKSSLVDQRMVAGYSNHLTRIRLNLTRVEPAYFSLWLRKLRETGYFTLQATRWVSQAAYKTSDLRKLSMELPPLTEQRRVVDLLSRAESIVRLRHEAQQKAAELVPAIFRRVFGDPESNPRGLQLRKVSDFVAQFQGGKNIQSGSEDPNGLRILKVSAVTSGRYLESESKPAPNNYVPPASHFVREGDMLFSRANTVDLVGATALVEGTDGRTLLPDKLWRIIWSEGVDVVYMHTLFQDRNVRRMLGKLATGTSDSMRNISQAKLFNLQLPVASLAEQRKFGLLARQAISMMSTQELGLVKAYQSFDSLMSNGFKSTGG